MRGVLGSEHKLVKEESGRETLALVQITESLGQPQKSLQSDCALDCSAQVLDLTVPGSALDGHGLDQTLLIPQRSLQLEALKDLHLQLKGKPLFEGVAELCTSTVVTTSKGDTFS